VRVPRFLNACFLCFFIFGFLGMGCSSFGFIYKRLPYLAGMRLDGEFDLESSQRAILDSSLKSLLKWHQNNELDKMDAALETLFQKLEGPLTPSDVDWAQRFFLDSRERLFSQIYFLSFDFLRSLTTIQVDHFEKKQKKNNEERFEDLELSVEKYAKKKSKSWQDQWEDWLDELTLAQEQRIREDAIQMYYIEKDLKPQILEGQKKFISFLRDWIQPQRDPKWDSHELMKQLWALTPPPESSPKFNLVWAQIRVVSLSATPSQRKHWQSQLKVWRERIQGMKG